MSDEHKVLKRNYGKLFDAISKVLFEQDPVGISFVDNTDEYDPETGTIIPRLKSARSAEDVQSIVYEEFCRWFGAETTGPKESRRYCL